MICKEKIATGFILNTIKQFTSLCIYTGLNTDKTAGKSVSVKYIFI